MRIQKSGRSPKLYAPKAYHSYAAWAGDHLAWHLVRIGLFVHLFVCPVCPTVLSCPVLCVRRSFLFACHLAIIIYIFSCYLFKCRPFLSFVKIVAANDFICEVIKFTFTFLFVCHCVPTINRILEHTEQLRYFYCHRKLWTCLSGFGCFKFCLLASLSFALPEFSSRKGEGILMTFCTFADCSSVSADYRICTWALNLPGFCQHMSTWIACTIYSGCP